MPSLRVILWSVSTKIKKNKAAITKNNLATARDVKLTTSIGQIKAAVPKTKVAQTITEPINSPRIIQVSPFLEAIIEK